MESDTFYIQDQSPGKSLFSEERRPVPVSIIFLLVFILSAVSVTFVEGLNLIAVGLGALAFFAFLFYSIRAGFLFASELKCLAVYFVIVTFGIFVAQYPPLFFTSYRTVFQVFLMTVMVTNYTRSVRTVKLLFFTVFLGCMIVGASAVWTGQYAIAEAEGERAVGLAMNANAFALNLIFATMIALYFFKVWKFWIFKIGLIGLVLVFGRLILASGSRKGFIGYAATLFLWFIFSYAVQIKQRPFAFVAGLIIIVGVAGLFFVWSRGSIVEKRFAGDQDYSRMAMYVAGFKLIASHFLLGVGLDHYRIYSTYGTYSHSNYIEVLSNCGIFGGIAYYLVYVILWLRLWKVGKYTMRPQERELIAIGKMYVILRCMLDFVVVSYFDKLNWILFGVLIGWTYSMEQQLKHEDPYSLHDAYSESEQEPHPAPSEIRYIET